MNLARATYLRRTAFAVATAAAAQSMGLPVMVVARAQTAMPDAQAESQPVQVPRLPPGVPMRTGVQQPAQGMPAPVVAQPAMGAPPGVQQVAQPQGAQQQGPVASLPELQALVAPIALYPDSLLAQMLLASTYPLDVAAATIWLQNKENARLSGPALEAALQQEGWDNSVKSLVQFPDALRILGNKLEWAQKLGDAYLAQPGELMQAVQALRTQARNAGHLKSGNEMVVTTDPLSNIIIQPANPQVVYVPMYNPTVVYGPWFYPAYPPWPVYNPAWGYVAFGVGFGVGAALWATPYWGRGYVYVNHGYYNRFNAAYNSPVYRGAARPGPGAPWAYNPARRGNVPYANPALQHRYAATPQQRQQLTQARSAAQNYWNKNPAARPTGAGAPPARAAGATVTAPSGGGSRATGAPPGGGGGASRGGGGRSGHR